MSHGLRKIKNLTNYLNQKLSFNSMGRWNNNTKKIKFQEQIRKLRKIAFGGLKLTNSLDSLSLPKKIYSLAMIKAKSDWNRQLAKRMKGFNILSNLIDNTTNNNIIHTFSVLKVLFEFKSQVDDDIKTKCRTNKLRSMLNNNLLKNNRVRRRFIRHKGDFFCNTDNDAAADQPQAINGQVKNVDNLVSKTTGINNFLVGDSAVSRVRDKNYYEDEDGSDEEYDNKVAYPVLRQGIDGTEKIIVHSNNKLNRQSQLCSMNNSVFLKPDSKYDIWDIKDQRLGGQSRIKQVENGITRTPITTRMDRDVDTVTGGYEDVQTRKDNFKKFGINLLGKNFLRGDIRHDNYNQKHADRLWNQGVQQIYDRGVLARSGTKDLQVVVNSPNVDSDASSRMGFRDRGSVKPFDGDLRAKDLGNNTGYNNGRLGLRNVLSQNQTPHRNSGKSYFFVVFLRFLFIDFQI